MRQAEAHRRQQQTFIVLWHPSSTQRYRRENPLPQKLAEKLESVEPAKR
jgi:hypothetical protein